VKISGLFINVLLFKSTFLNFVVNFQIGLCWKEGNKLFVIYCQFVINGIRCKYVGNGIQFVINKIYNGRRCIFCIKYTTLYILFYFFCFKYSYYNGSGRSIG